MSFWINLDMSNLFFIFSLPVNWVMFIFHDTQLGSKLLKNVIFTKNNYWYKSVGVFWAILTPLDRMHFWGILKFMSTSKIDKIHFQHICAFAIHLPNIYIQYLYSVFALGIFLWVSINNLKEWITGYNR